MGCERAGSRASFPRADYRTEDCTAPGLYAGLQVSYGCSDSKRQEETEVQEEPG